MCGFRNHLVSIGNMIPDSIKSLLFLGVRKPPIRESAWFAFKRSAVRIRLSPPLKETVSIARYLPSFSFVPYRGDKRIRRRLCRRRHSPYSVDASGWCVLTSCGGSSSPQKAGLFRDPDYCVSARRRQKRHSMAFYSVIFS